MNASDLVHPDSEQLAAFATGHASEETASEISAHLGQCEACRTLIDSMPNDTLLSLLKKPALPETVAGPTAAATTSREIPADLAAHPRYQVLEVLGSGGMGAVYKAEHRLMERHVALKVMSPRLLNRPGMVERFEREVKAAARLAHANIVAAYDADRAGDTHFLIMEFVEGVSLAQRVHEDGPMSVKEACDYLYQAACGLAHAHECGMVHRDIKPHNLMLTSAGQVKILDFGLARFVRETASKDPPTVERTAQPDHSPLTTNDSPLTEAGAVMGTVDFIAPEQANDARQADIRADIYSLGCTLYYLLAGHVPFPSGTAQDKLAAHREQKPAALAGLRSDLPSGLTQVIERMMAKDPAQRYQTPVEVARALAPFAGRAFWSRSRIRRFAIAAALFVAAIVACVIIYIQTDNGEFVIEADSDKVAVMVNGKGVKIRDTGNNREYLLSIGRHRLRAGEYQIDVQELPAGVEFSTTAFALKRGDNRIVSVTFNAKKDPGYLKDDALRWFPGNATFFYASNMEVFPVFSRLQFILMGENLRKGSDQFWRFKDLLGTIDRVSYADVDESQGRDRSRVFVRFTGSIKHNRLVDYFRQEWTGLTIEQTQSNGEPVTFIHDSQSDKGIFGGAIALVGNTDLIFAVHGNKQKHLDAVRECLELRAGRGTSLPVAQAKALEEIPASAWCFAAGVPPAQIKKHWFTPLLIARYGAMSMSGTNDVELRFRGTFPSEAQAKLFVTVLQLTVQAVMKSPVVVSDPSLSAGAAKAISSLRVETDGDRVTSSIQIPSVAWAALMEKLQDTPPEKFKNGGPINPAKEK
jgi:tRNA A-37 threonylcarbamoyl transferase component Bud32